jgi:hypothetical protein
LGHHDLLADRGDTPGPVGTGGDEAESLAIPGKPGADLKPALPPAPPPRLHDDDQPVEGRVESNYKQVGKALPYLRQEAGDIPIWLLLGWIDKESSGNMGLETPGPLDEVGWFQLSRDERAELGGKTPIDRNSVLGRDAKGRVTDESKRTAVRIGIRLVRRYTHFIQGRGVDRGAPAFWHLAKLAHTVGMGKTRHLVTVMQDLHAKGKPVPDLNECSWDDIRAFVAHNKHSPVNLDRLDRISYLADIGHTMERKLAGVTGTDTK